MTARQRMISNKKGCKLGQKPMYFGRRVPKAGTGLGTHQRLPIAKMEGV